MWLAAGNFKTLQLLLKVIKHSVGRCRLIVFKKETAARGSVRETTAKLQRSEWEADSREEVRRKERKKG